MKYLATFVILSLLVLLHPPIRATEAAGSLNVAYGSYTGDGTDNRDITVSPSFPIKAVFYHATTAQNNNAGGAAMSISGMGDLAVPIYQNDTARANIIQSMGTGTFQLGSGETNYNGNRSGVVYDYVAIGGDSTTINTGTYTGNGAGSRSFTGVGFQPGIVFVFDTANNTKAARFGNAGSTSHYLANAADVSNQITSLDADGFTVGSASPDTNVNTSGHTYYWLAIKEVTGSSKASSYTGDGSSSHAITGVGFQPDLVFVKGASNQFAVFRSAQNVGDDTSPTEFNTANFAGGVKSLDAGGFTLGSDGRVNSNTATYMYFALKNTSNAAATSILGLVRSFWIF